MITKPSDFMKSDSRFKQWGKLVTKSDVDLSQNNGYSLKGQWGKWNENVSLVPGRYLVCASETGSRANHGYDYALIDGNGQKIEKDTRVAALDNALTEGRITEDQRVKAKNSVLYAYALFVSLEQA